MRDKLDEPPYPYPTSIEFAKTYVKFYQVLDTHDCEILLNINIGIYHSKAGIVKDCVYVEEWRDYVHVGNIEAIIKIID